VSGMGLKEIGNWCENSRLILIYYFFDNFLLQSISVYACIFSAIERIIRIQK
jgi:hypothetical protein